MLVKIRRMTEDEFERFYQWSVEDHAKELMGELNISREEAIMETKKEVAGMLPDGFHTEHNDFVTIVAEEENAGFIWAVYEQSQGRKQCFLCDFAVWELKRRKGYGEMAMRLLEKRAVEAGCEEMVLFVADQNDSAKALYKKCGYQDLRQESYGKYMVKRL